MNEDVKKNTNINDIKQWILIISVAIIAISVLSYFLIFIPVTKKINETNLKKCLNQARIGHSFNRLDNCIDKGLTPQKCIPGIAQAEADYNPNKFKQTQIDKTLDFFNMLPRECSCALNLDLAKAINAAEKEDEDSCFKLYPVK